MNYRWRDEVEAERARAQVRLGAKVCEVARRIVSEVPQGLDEVQSLVAELHDLKLWHSWNEIEAAARKVLTLANERALSAGFVLDCLSRTPGAPPADIGEFLRGKLDDGLVYHDADSNVTYVSTDGRMVEICLSAMRLASYLKELRMKGS